MATAFLPSTYGGLNYGTNSVWSQSGPAMASNTMGNGFFVPSEGDYTGTTAHGGYSNASLSDPRLQHYFAPSNQARVPKTSGVSWYHGTDSHDRQDKTSKHRSRGKPETRDIDNTAPYRHHVKEVRPGQVDTDDSTHDASVDVIEVWPSPQTSSKLGALQPDSVAEKLRWTSSDRLERMRTALWKAQPLSHEARAHMDWNSIASEMQKAFSENDLRLTSVADYNSLLSQAAMTDELRKKHRDLERTVGKLETDLDAAERFAYLDRGMMEQLRFEKALESSAKDSALKEAKELRLDLCRSDARYSRLRKQQNSSLL